MFRLNTSIGHLSRQPVPHCIQPPPTSQSNRAATCLPPSLGSFAKVCSFPPALQTLQLPNHEPKIKTESKQMFHLLPSIPPECTNLLDPSNLNLFFSLFILAGILVSYLPQHHRIISRGTAEGISPVFLLLGVTSGTCAFANILILSKGVLACCGKGIGGFNCFAASLGVAQVGTQWCSFGIMSVCLLSLLPLGHRSMDEWVLMNNSRLLLFLIYFPRDVVAAPTTSRFTMPKTQSALSVAILCVAHLVVVAVLTFYFSLLSPPASYPAHSSTSISPQLTAWANFLGIQSMILASLQYIPQLFTTWTLKHVGSLSIPMMCIQTPGSFVWAVSLASREGTKWSSWITYVVTGVLQGALLIMCIIWELKDRKERKEMSRGENGAAVEGERRPLLASEAS